MKNITKVYCVGTQHSTVLHAVSLIVNQGESVAIVGASGSGKSTLMNIIGLLDQADSGHYYFYHHNIADCDADTLSLLRNRHIGFVFQQFNLLPRLTVQQNVALPLIYAHVHQDEVETRTYAALKQVGMPSYGSRYPNQLSGGQQQRVAIARALVSNPQLILADEPTGSLDSHTSNEILRLFLQLQQQGITIIIVTHDPTVAGQCHRRLHMNDGQITEEVSEGY